MQLSAALGEMLASLVVRMFGDGEAPVLASAGPPRIGGDRVGEVLWRCCLSCRGAVTVTSRR